MFYLTGSTGKYIMQVFNLVLLPVIRKQEFLLLSYDFGIKDGRITISSCWQTGQLHRVVSACWGASRCRRPRRAAGPFQYDSHPEHCQTPCRPSRRQPDLRGTTPRAAARQGGWRPLVFIVQVLAPRLALLEMVASPEHAFLILSH